MKKNIILGFILSLFVFQLAGCSAVKKDMAHIWNSLKGNQTEKQSGSREDAAQKYKYKGQRDELFAEPPVLTPAVARPGDTINHELQYTLLSQQKNKRFVVSEVVILSSSSETMDLVKREAEKPQGTHVSTLQFTIPKDLDAGTYKIISSLSAGNLKKTVQGEFVVRQ